MKLNTFCGHLVHMLSTPMSEFTELQRALKEQSSHFDPESNLDDGARHHAAAGGVGFDRDLLKGRAGPGGGIEADPFRAAFFLLAVALAGPRKECAHATWRTWHLHQSGSVRAGFDEDFVPTITTCPLTGMHLFGEALRKIVEDVELAARVQEVRAAADLSGEIYFDDGGVSKFERTADVRGPRLYRLSVIRGDVWRLTAELVNQES